MGSVYKLNGKIYNTAVIFDSHGELIERYGKVYLAGEKWFTPGNHISYFELEGIPSTVMICHDERYPELVRLPAIQGARVVYYISHESGMRQESKIAPFRAQLMARAVENGLFIVSANAPASPQDLSGSHGQTGLCFRTERVQRGQLLRRRRTDRDSDGKAQETAASVEQTDGQLVAGECRVHAQKSPPSAGLRIGGLPR